MLIDQALELFKSKHRKVRVRAAKLLVGNYQEVPLSVLLKILDDFHEDGLGAGVELALLKRADPEMTNAMVLRLRSPATFVREVACKILGKRGGPKVASALLVALEDKNPAVRHEAGFALADLADPCSAPQLLKLYRASAKDDINVRCAMECALDKLGVKYAKHPEPIGSRG